MAEFNLENMRIMNKSDTFLNWKKNNPILKNGEMGFESDTYRTKVGDGSTPWNDLQYNNITEFSGLEVVYSDLTPKELCSIPANFFLNTATVEVVEGFNSNVTISIGTEDDRDLVASAEDLYLSEEGYVFVFKINKIITAPTKLYAFISGSRSNGKIIINIK